MRGRVALASLCLAGLLAVPAEAQSALERTPNLDGPWVSGAGVAHFHVVHRFWVTDPPSRKVVNTPTLLAAAGLGNGFLAGLRYGSNSSLVTGEFNEWEVFGRWRPLEQTGGVADLSVTAAWNGAAESVDGELALARDLGPVRLNLSARAFSAFAGGDAEAAFGAGLVWRFGRNAALAGDLVTLAGDTTAAWSVGLQLRIPTTPHTLSIHATNAVATTLQSSSLGGGRRLYGFEFTVPITLKRYFGGETTPEPPPPPGPGPEPTDTTVVTMDNQLRFLPDTVRIRAGQAVRWVNGSVLVHTVTADPQRAVRAANVSLPAGARPFDSGDILPDQAYVRVFPVPGTYRYVCIPHELAGMVGVVVVSPE